MSDRVAATLTTSYERGYESFARLSAIAGSEGSMSYAELGEAARHFAGGLSELGARPGDRVIVLSANRPETFVVDHGIAAGGFVRVPLSTRLHAREVANIARDCEPSVLVVDAERQAEVVGALKDVGLRTMVVALDPGAGKADAPYSELLGASAIRPVRPNPEDLAWLPYTSGTTGEPKGVMLSHRAILACARNLMAELPAIESDDVVLHVAPLSHLSGYTGVAYTLRGASQVAMRSFKPEAALAAIAEHRVTVLPMVPTMLNMLLPALDTSRWDTSSLHTIIYAGSAIAPARLARLVGHLGEVFVQAYGLSEIPFPITSLSKHSHRFDIQQALPARLGSAGRVSPFVEIRIVGPDNESVPPGEQGEIQARSDTAMSGYWNRAKATADTLLEGGWVATGDVGRLEDGYLHIVDRKKDMIVTGGFNVFPAEIESAISTLGSVAEVAVIGVPDPRWGETVKALVVPEKGKSVTIEDVDRVCRERIAAYKRPRSIEFLDHLPKTGSGKIQRHELRRQYWEGSDRLVGG
ncbi:AMP-binding protein [Actinomadura vinacea]|uniref:AMP-binding protein n=1 Tax=Actinomadura vinacea TaxID=115336 RepID=A0ABN3JQH8_9ACTN